MFKADSDNLVKTLFPGGAPRNVNTCPFSNLGIELSVKSNQSNWLNYTLNYTYIHLNEPLLATPEHSLYIGGNYSLGNFDLNMGIQNITNLITTVNPPVQKENYILLNSNISYRFSSNFELFLIAENLLDESYQINYDYPMPATTFFPGFNFHF